MKQPARSILFSAHASGGELEVRARGITGPGEERAGEIVVGRAPLGSRLAILGSADGVVWSEAATIPGAEAVGTRTVSVFMNVDAAKLAGGLIRFRAEPIQTPVPGFPRPPERRESQCPS